jgi:S-adenosylmethionine:tRNA ribosyltransferase-isomerase
MVLTRKYSYELPEELIAQVPSERRDMSRMMLVDRAAGTISHHRSRDIADILSSGDLLVTNDTKVIPARVSGRKRSGGGLELLFVEELAPSVWSVLMRASRRPKPGEPFEFAAGQATARILEEHGRGEALIEVDSELPVLELLELHGSAPLPPYIKRADGEQEGDRERYQTIYAATPGAVAAPTAGLHFTPELFDALQKRGVERCSITLHVGPGTFRPVSSDHIEDHVMDSERYEIAAETAAKINGRRGRCVAVGSTSVRTLETACSDQGSILPGSGRSELYIYPPYRFKVVDAMLTNFHLPCSTLLMMVCALGGEDLIMEAYRTAVAEQYRFYSYGDCMLII